LVLNTNNMLNTIPRKENIEISMVNVNKDSKKKKNKQIIRE